MSYKRQRLQESHIFTNQEDCSFNTPQLDDEFLHPHMVEASSSNTPLPTQNQHNHHPSASTSLSLVQDHVPPESAPSTNDLGFFINGHEATGQASYQRKRGRISYAYIDFGDKTFKCCHCMALFWKSKMFRKCIRAYNSMFAFTSMGVNIDQSVNRQPGPYVFKINGHCHHLMGSLLPSNENAPKFAQLYIYDVSNEVSNRMSQFPHSTSDSCLDQTINLTILGINCNYCVKEQMTAENIVIQLQMTLWLNCDIGAYRSERDIIIESSSDTLQRISKLHPKFMALQYPLLFPFGEDGYRTNISFADNYSNISGKRQRVPMRGFYAYVIQEREYGEDTLTKGGRLYQQFLVDAFANIEEDRLDYIRMNQNDLRSDLYQNISEAVLRGDVEGSSIGKIILPSSFTGGPRYMINNYQCMHCRAYGNPDLFITFTCNTKWPEIERELDKSRGYKPEDKPDIITRVFRTKLLDMLKFIKSGAPFGETIADVHSIEFQKRGLPHTHILVWLASKFKFRTSADIDSIVSAEIPDKNIDPLCHDIVCKFMLHGPCGVAKPGAFNVMHKHDRNDEVQAYLNCRFICPYEAVWRILQFPIHSRYPPVERLQIHLPFQQNIVFSGSKSLQSVLRRPELYYSEFPKKYVWDSRQKQWTMRSKGFSLGRIPYVHPAAGELYFLRLLLNHIKGSISFADLRNVHGVLHPTFQLACKAHGLLGDDKEWSEAFCEAIATASSPQLRQLFVGIILFCQVADPLILFNQFWQSMCDDILYKLKSCFKMPNLILPDDQLIYELEQLFNASATTLQDHSLPMPDGQLLKEITNKLLREELDYDLSELRGTGKTFLWHTIINRVRSESLIVLAVASSGIASLLLPNEALDRSMRDVLSEGTNYNKDLPFVIPGGSKEQIINASLTSSILWPKFTVMTLTENMRLSTDGLSLEEKAEIREFSEWILSVGNGQISDLPSLSEADECFVTIPFHLLLPASCDPIPTIVSTIYPNICDVQIDPGFYRERAIVTIQQLLRSMILYFTLHLEQNVYILALILFQRHQQRVMMQAHYIP
uniref:ATP-dependent DNA helicase n=1 Tax=Salix viminalis TaxID=40686 RepID=A0A6N2MNQ0_SALVM